MKYSVLSILTDEEIHYLYKMFEFDDEERTFQFELGASDIDYSYLSKDKLHLSTWLLQGHLFV